MLKLLPLLDLDFTKKKCKMYQKFSKSNLSIQLNPAEGNHPVFFGLSYAKWCRIQTEVQ